MTQDQASFRGDLEGEHYTVVLEKLHRDLKPRTYFEIGTQSGQSLAFARCPCVAVDPDFKIASVKIMQILKNEAGFFFCMKSDDFFARYDPVYFLRSTIDLAFLDGMHLCEFLLRDFMNTERACSAGSTIILHDCLPVEPAMADRVHGTRPMAVESRKGKWAGDVWKTAIVLKRYRRDLKITVIDSAPTGLVIVTKLDPCSTFIRDNYKKLSDEMAGWSLDSFGVDSLFDELQVKPTASVM